MQTTTRNWTAKATEMRHEPVSAKSNFFFSQDCTACGRQVRVRFEHLGRQVECRHCGCQLIATQGTMHSVRDAMMQRADELLT